MTRNKNVYQELITQIAAQRQSLYSSDIQPPATEASLLHLRQRACEEFAAELPEHYLDFLKVTDGLNWDGLFIYASDKTPVVGKPTVFMHSFIEENLEWRSYERRHDYLFFADDDISLYALNLVAGCFEIQDRSSGTVMEMFDTFDEMITKALKQCLQADDFQVEADEES